jgi:ligand-binding sensor domain-containing protein
VNILLVQRTKGFSGSMVSTAQKKNRSPVFYRLRSGLSGRNRPAVIWICTYGNGFFLLENEKLTHFPQNGGMLSYVHYIINAGKGYLWLPSNNGLFVASKRALFAYARKKPAFLFIIGLHERQGYGPTNSTAVRSRLYNVAEWPGKPFDL